MTPQGAWPWRGRLKRIASYRLLQTGSAEKRPPAPRGRRLPESWDMNPLLPDGDREHRTIVDMAKVSPRRVPFRSLGILEGYALLRRGPSRDAHIRYERMLPLRGIPCFAIRFMAAVSRFSFLPSSVRGVATPSRSGHSSRALRFMPRA